MNGSTDEVFLLVAKQSRKVKVFGQPTYGVLDISNTNKITSPDGLFELDYCMSKSARIPEFCIDGIGIQPDFFINRNISKINWVEVYTRNIRIELRINYLIKSLHVI